MLPEPDVLPELFAAAVPVDVAPEETAEEVLPVTVLVPEIPPRVMPPVEVTPVEIPEPPADAAAAGAAAVPVEPLEPGEPEDPGAPLVAAALWPLEMPANPTEVPVEDAVVPVLPVAPEFVVVMGEVVASPVEVELDMLRGVPHAASASAASHGRRNRLEVKSRIMDSRPPELWGGAI